MNLEQRLPLKRRRFLLLCQLVATAAVLGWVPGNAAKLVIMLAVWAAGFGRLSAAELALAAGVNLLFAVLNSAALARGIFCFDQPDFLGMPTYEYLMWGFYTLHAIRLFGGQPPRHGVPVALAAAVVFALPFATIGNPTFLLLAAAGILAACFIRFHEPLDLAYAGYMAAIGVLIEHVGTWTGQWHYPDAQWGSVPLWFIPMWAGVGLFTRRLLLPLLHRDGGRRAAFAR